jgi:hypothetical protein
MKRLPVCVARKWAQWPGPPSSFGPKGIELTCEYAGVVLVLPLPVMPRLDVDS